MAAMSVVWTCASDTNASLSRWAWIGQSVTAFFTAKAVMAPSAKAAPT
eukprot:CAMPEP_0204025940 /NCGR_PEP_ID=MMETSP0360-20130528/43769_1 /ASSEMBLY_ACC=CAM_ASM_000342 /TAXON_ID=268821 /ORGANISM="Scrippsiella Hangoei, Strain SHTV-5" /LENGTH=47 /DNA_ID= /DNA_START= /DNA_END= /DNA_ORIENTATION=